MIAPHDPTAAAAEIKRLAANYASAFASLRGPKSERQASEKRNALHAAIDAQAAAAQALHAEVAGLTKQVMAYRRLQASVDERRAFESHQRCELEQRAADVAGERAANARLTDEVQALQARAEAAEAQLAAERALLDSGCIVLSGRDSWGEDTDIEHRGVNLRDAISRAIAARTASIGQPIGHQTDTASALSDSAARTGRAS